MLFHLAKTAPTRLMPQLQSAIIYHVQLILKSKFSICWAGKSSATGVQPAGHYQIIWDALNRPSSVYFYNIQADRFNEVKKMILLK